MRIDCFILLHNSDNPVNTLGPCRMCLEELHALPVVQKSFKIELTGGFKAKFHKHERKEIIAAVCRMNHVICVVTQIVGQAGNKGFCLFQNETLVQMFCGCPVVKIFWKDVIMWWNTKRPENINPNSIEILYGYKPEITSFYALIIIFLLLNIMYILQETSQRLQAYGSFSPYWKVKLNAKDKWPLKTLIMKIQS